MATSHIGTDNLHLEGPDHIHVFGKQAFIEGDAKAVNLFGFFIQTSDTVADDIETIIAEDLQTHPVEAIDHILVDPYSACLLFLDGHVGREQINHASENGNDITLTNVKFQAGDEKRGFKVIIRNGHEGFATMNKAGKVL